MQSENGETTLSGGKKIDRRKRVERLKKMILFGVATAIIVPTILCVLLGIQLGRVSKELKLLKEQNAIINSNTEEMLSIPADADKQPSEQAENDKSSATDVTKPAQDTRKVYLTFDDGPSIYTEEILDILELYGVKATFFVIGQEDEKYAPMYKRIVEDGHSIGMHSYSHKYTEIYESLDSFKADLEKIRSLVKEKAGVECSLYRFPGGSSNSIGKKHIQEFIGYLDEEQIVYFDWNVSSKDATGVPLSVDEIVQNSTADLEKYRSAVILFHDSATKYNTVQALPKIIETIQAMENTEIVPITETSVPVQQIKKEE